MGVVSTTGGHGFQLITFLLEQGPEGLVMLWVIIAAIATKCLDQVSVPGLHAPKGELNILGFESENEQFEMNWAFFTYVFIAVPIVSIGIPVVKLVVGSFYCTDGHAKADWSEWLEITDASLASAWAGKKIPYCVMCENYMREKIHFKQDFLETMLHREELFAASFTTHDLMHYINTFTTQNLGHSPLRDKDEVATVYNRGNDFYGFFLGEPMKYSCASTGPWTTRSKKPSTGCLTSSAVRARWKKARTTLTLLRLGLPRHLLCRTLWCQLVRNHPLRRASKVRYPANQGPRRRRQRADYGPGLPYRPRGPPGDPKGLRRYHLPRNGRARRHQELPVLFAPGAVDAQARRRLLPPDCRPSSCMAVRRLGVGSLYEQVHLPSRRCLMPTRLCHLAARTCWL